MSKESKAERAVRQDAELSAFVAVLRRAGNIVEEEFPFDVRPSDSSQSPPIPRKWRFDVVMPNCQWRWLAWTYTQNIAIEIEGYGRHQSMKGFNADLEKYGEAFAQGWTLLRVSRKMIADGTALDFLARRGVAVQSRTPIQDNIERNGGKYVGDGKMRFPSGMCKVYDNKGNEV